MSNLLVRVITAVVGVSILLTAILFDQMSYMIVFLLITLFSIYEFYQLVKRSGAHPFMIWGLLSTALLFCLTFLIASSSVDFIYFLIVFVMLSSISGLAIFRKNREQIVYSIAYSVLGIIYIALPMSMMNFVAFQDGNFHYELIIGVLFCLWANDTGGYFVGKSIGKHKLYESISPNKTIEGSLGGLMLALVVAAGLFYMLEFLSLIEWLGLAAIISVFGSIGDLAESLIKRNLQIKDSGTSIPGHGGFLDRFDGLFLALPFATLYIHLII